MSWFRFPITSLALVTAVGLAACESGVDPVSAPVAEPAVARSSGNQPPVASFTSSCSGELRTFDGSASHDPDGQIIRWHWDFGDGGSADGSDLEIVQHVYEAEDTYIVVLNIFDDQFARGKAVDTVSVFF